MERYIDVMKQSSELAATVMEGLVHMEGLVGDGKYEESMALFPDIIEAFFTIENSLRVLPADSIGSIEPTTNDVRNAIERTVGCYETNDYVKIGELLQLTLVPVFQAWQKELNQAFQPYLVS